MFPFGLSGHGFLVMRLVEVPFDRSVFECPVHSLDLSIGPWMPEVGQPMVDVQLCAGAPSRQETAPLIVPFDATKFPKVQTR
jgi:hypothetical protein